MYNGKVFAAFSKKLEKHGHKDKLPLFSLCIDNKVPYLGSFSYSPIYFFLKKEEGKVTEVAIIDIPVKWNDFISKVRAYSGLALENIEMVPKLHVKYHFQLTDLNENFDYDQDLVEQAEEDAKEQAEKAQIEADKFEKSK